jgi:HEAT repeat protein
LEQSFASTDPAVRAVAVAAIARVESDNGRKVDFLQRALDDPESVVRVAAIDELGAMGRAAEPAAEKLYALTEQSGERDQALEVLAGLRIRSVPLLVKATTNSDAYVRQFAVERLGQLGKAAQEAVPELRKLLQAEPEDFVKRAARTAIRDIERAD